MFETFYHPLIKSKYVIYNTQTYGDVYVRYYW